MIASERLRGALSRSGARRFGDHRCAQVVRDHHGLRDVPGARRRRPSHGCFQVAASYMPSRELSVDPYMNTAQWSRRFLGLRLFLSLASAGWSGHAAHIERAVAQTALHPRRARGSRLVDRQ